MISVHVSHDDPSYVARVEAKRLNSWSDFFMGLNPATLAILHKRMPPWLVSWIVGVRRLSRIHNDQAFWMFDEPCTNRQARRPVGVRQDVEYARCASVIVRSLMPRFDLHTSGLYRVDIHATSLMQYMSH